MEYKCKYCDFETDNKHTLGGHVCSKYREKKRTICRSCNKSISKNQYKRHLASCLKGNSRERRYSIKYDADGNRRAWNYGLKKTNNSSIKKAIATLKRRIENGEISWKGRKVSDETKEKLRRSRFEYMLKENRSLTGYERRSKGLLSLNEEWVFDNLQTLGIIDKYSVINEFPMYPYFIDFAFIDLKIALEVDGQQHYVYGDRIRNDKLKNELLLRTNWRIFRICECEKENFSFLELLDFIGNNSSFRKPKHNNKCRFFSQVRALHRAYRGSID